MTEFKREFFKNDEVLGKLFEAIKKQHIVAEHTKKVLIENKGVKDFCEEARHFVMMGETNPLFIHYDVASWFKAPNGVSVTIDSIGVYENFLEYEKARSYQLHKAEKKNIPNIN